MAQCIDRAASFGQNLYVDTRGAAGEPVSFTQAVINGLAQGGGLYVPEELPTLSLDEICALARLPYAQRAAAIYKAFNVDLPDEAIDELMGRAYGDNFDDGAICPITSLDESTHILELWHGRRAPSRTWPCSACPISSRPAPRSCARRERSITSS